MAKKEKVRTVWDREFRLVKHGLDEAQVTEFVDELMAKLKEAQEAQEGAERPADPSPLYTLAERTLQEAENLARTLVEEGKQIRAEAQAEADRIIAETQNTLQEQINSIGRVAKAAAEEGQRVVQAARENGALIEAESRRWAEQFIDHAKAELQRKIRSDLKGASEKLVPYVEDVVRNVQALQIDLDAWEASVPPRSWSQQGPAAEGGSISLHTDSAKDTAATQHEVVDTTLSEASNQKNPA